MPTTILNGGRAHPWLALIGLVLAAMAAWTLAQPAGSCLADTPSPTATPQALIYLPLVRASGGPQICFDATPRAGTRPLAVRFSNTSLGVTQPYSATWDFGDGQVGAGGVVTHTYTAAGVYSVTLALETRSGTVRRTEPGFVVVSEPEDGASFTATPRSGASPLVVQFTDTTPGQANTPHYWTFGEGTSSSEVAPRHTYTQAGQYTVTLTLMTEGENLQRREPNFITVYPAQVPDVTFNADVTSGTVPLRVKLTDTTPGMADYMHTWDFGDGQQESVNRVPWIWHTYTAAGDYTVTLTIQAPSGAISGNRRELHPCGAAGPAGLLQRGAALRGRAADGVLHQHDAECRRLQPYVGLRRRRDVHRHRPGAYLHGCRQLHGDPDHAQCLWRKQPQRGRLTSRLIRR